VRTLHACGLIARAASNPVIPRKKGNGGGARTCRKTADSWLDQLRRRLSLSGRSRHARIVALDRREVIDPKWTFVVVLITGPPEPRLGLKLKNSLFFFPVGREFGNGDGFVCDCVRHHFPLLQVSALSAERAHSSKIQISAGHNGEVCSFAI